MDTNTLTAISKLESTIRQVGKGFYNSAAIESIDPQTYASVSYDLLDLLIIGALTESSVLLTGRTDSGKTDLAKIVMTALFGAEEKGWHRLDLDLDFGREQYTDVDFGVVSEGKKSSEGMYSALPYLSLPGLIVDEWNRAPPKIANKMLHFFDKDVNIAGGVRVKTGHSYEDGKRYFFLVAAINEGEDYEGTFPIDKAARRRAIIEVPMDNFVPTIEDRLMINTARKGRLETQDAYGASLDERMKELLAVNRAVEQIPVDGSANHFLLYLESMDHCVRSYTLSKLGINFSGGICTKGGVQQVTAQIGEPTTGGGACHYYTFYNNMCPAVRAISEGTSINLLRVARGFAALRAAKSSTGEDAEEVKDVKVYTEDLVAAFPFVAYSKLGLSQPWVDKNFQGSLWLAMNAALAETQRKFSRAYTVLGSQIEEILSEQLSNEGLKDITQYCEREDPWFMKSLVPYLSSLKNGAEFIAAAKLCPVKLL